MRGLTRGSNANHDTFGSNAKGNGKIGRCHGHGSRHGRRALPARGAAHDHGRANASRSLRLGIRAQKSPTANTSCNLCIRCKARCENDALRKNGASPMRLGKRATQHDRLVRIRSKNALRNGRSIDEHSNQSNAKWPIDRRARQTLELDAKGPFETSGHERPRIKTSQSDTAAATRGLWTMQETHIASLLVALGRWIFAKDSTSADDVFTEPT